MSVAVWGKAGCVYSLFCDSFFFFFDVALGFFGVGEGRVFGICTHFTSYFVILL